MVWSLTGQCVVKTWSVDCVTLTDVANRLSTELNPCKSSGIDIDGIIIGSIQTTNFVSTIIKPRTTFNAIFVAFVSPSLVFILTDGKAVIV